MTYKTHFPDFDRGSEIDMLVGAGWSDESWKNDGCPRVHCGNAAIWIDYADPAKRVCEVAGPYFVQYLVDGQFTAESGEEHAALKDALAAIYAEWIGYNPFEDDPNDTIPEVAATLADWVKAGQFA